MEAAFQKCLVIQCLHVKHQHIPFSCLHLVINEQIKARWNVFNRASDESASTPIVSGDEREERDDTLHVSLILRGKMSFMETEVLLLAIIILIQLLNNNHLLRLEAFQAVTIWHFTLYHTLFSSVCVIVYLFRSTHCRSFADVFFLSYVTRIISHIWVVGNTF